LSAMARPIRIKNKTGGSASTALWFAVCCAAAVLQISSPGASAQGRPQPAASDQRSSIRVEVNLVGLLASVLDKNNRPAPDLQREQFEILEEGKPQKIELFETETQQPLDLILMIDSSLSETTKLRFEIDAAEKFARRVMRPVDRLAVYEFGDTVTRLSDFSNQPERVRAALQRIEPGTGTALYDAVYLGSRALDRDKPERRRVLVLMTDAGETTSRADFS
jgi:Ca-activated chloride channel family protein